ncbi:MAG: ACT domain-containing protein [Oscillospiraceae bacterium]|nr:ACT domain-containing protein [Oscillospiraceae bacterium]MCD7792946.1 ACT domain-containing protein [Oscillospiraceae bacterium]MCD8016948.1 ACT domain-containing protein [Oscillospiraceae bacterium]MCD8067254.1 ACT domain-containing protein [Oscillospiraceae bacterium]MCD8099446.1 ACT domain-containing protein [Oscillospiraceae bacterium]
MSIFKTKYYVVEASVLPEVFTKVCEAKELLETGAADTVADAVAQVGLSRSAFYKYKDSVRPFRDMKRDQVLTVSVLMRDEPGSVSAVISIFADYHANILTVNQSIPTNGVAIITISMTPEFMTITFDEFKAKMEELPVVIRMELLAG